MPSTRGDIDMTRKNPVSMTAFDHTMTASGIKALGQGFGKGGRHVLGNKNGDIDLVTEIGHNLYKSLGAAGGDTNKYSLNGSGTDYLM